MYQLKPIQTDAVAKALLKAERYRLLNEPREAESICRDVLAVDPANQEALVTLLLTLTDQFEHGVAPDQAGDLVPRLQDEYSRSYYSGVICERWAKAQMDAGTPGHIVFDWIQQAMNWFEAAEKLSPAGNNDAILRWNTCVRMLDANKRIRPREEDTEMQASFSD
jgi:hypothetical protein